MYPSGLHYFPVAWPVLLILIALLGLVVGIVTLRVSSFAAASLGIGLRTVLTVLFLSLLGSYINVPIAYLPQHSMSSAAVITYFGVPYVVPLIHDWPATILAVNVGGGVIPVLLSCYLMQRNRLYVLSVAGIAFVATVCHLLARPIPGFGIALPIFVPALATAVVSIALSRRYAGPLAYISGSLGTLIGADLLNLNKLRGLGAPIASIGGAGTFDGIFVTGILAVLYAGVVTGMRIRRSK